MLPHKGFPAAALSLDASTFYSSLHRVLTIQIFYQYSIFFLFVNSRIGWIRGNPSPSRFQGRVY